MMVSEDVTVPDSQRRHQIATAEGFYADPQITAGRPHRALRLTALRGVASGPAPAELAFHLFGPEVAVPPADAISGEVVAYVNEARWIADCPDKRCNAAQVVTPDDPRFLCAVCGNLSNRRRWYAVVFPSADERAEIEALIAQRPNVENVNWSPGETVEEVRRLNRKHGVSDRGR